MSQPFYKKSPRDELVTSIILPDTPVKQQKPQQIERSKSIKKIAQQVQAVPDYNCEPYLQEQLQKSKKLVGFAERQAIQQHQTLIQTKVHDIQAGQSENQVLSNVFKMSAANPYIQKEIMQVVSKAEQKVSKNISENIKPKKQVPLTKDDLRQLQKVDKYRMLKIKNGEIKQKVGDLRQQLEHQYYQKKANYKLPSHQNVKQSDYYSMENPRTHQANQFIHRIQSQRSEQKRMYQQYLNKKKEEQNRRKFMQIQRKQIEAQQRKQRLEQIYQQKLMKKKQQQQQNYRKKEDIKQWSKIFQKQRPLYMRKQQQFIENQLIPEIYNRRQKLFQIKMARRPIDVNDLNEHDQRYMEYKRDDAIRQQAQLQIQKERHRANYEDMQHLYKGKYRYMALEEMMNERMRNSMDQKDIQRQKKAKQIVYAQQVKQRMMEQMKLKQLQTLNLEKKQFTKRQRNIDGTTSFDVSDTAKMTSQTDPKADGKKNLHFLKQLVRQKGVRRDKPIIKLIGERNVYPDYLHDGSEKRRKSLNMNTLSVLDQTNSSVQGSPNVDSLLAIEKRLDNQVKRSEVRKKFQSLDYRNDASIQQNQINAAKMKLKLINQFD